MRGRRGVGIAALLGSLLFSAEARADSMLLLHPVDDALVVSDPTLLDQNYGSDPQLLAWANYPVYGARSYLKFELAGLPVGETVTFARLNFFQFMGGGYSFGVDVFRVGDDTFSESTLTWNHQPVLYPDAADLISQSPLTGSERGWVSFDLLTNGAWNPALDLSPGDGKLSLIVRVSGGEVSTQRAHSFCSKDAGPLHCLVPGEAGPVYGRAPQLIIGTPEPALGTMLAAGVAPVAFVADTVRRRARRRHGRDSNDAPCLGPTTRSC